MSAGGRGDVSDTLQTLSLFTTQMDSELHAIMGSSLATIAPTLTSSSGLNPNANRHITRGSSDERSSDSSGLRGLGPKMEKISKEVDLKMQQVREEINPLKKRGRPKGTTGKDIEQRAAELQMKLNDQIENCLP